MINSAPVYSEDYMKRLTVTVPKHVFDFLKKKVPTGKVSDYVSDAVQSQITRNLTKPSTDPFEDFLQGYKIITKKNNISVREAIGRDKH